jgi:hypothetical protein
MGRRRRVGVGAVGSLSWNFDAANGLLLQYTGKDVLLYSAAVED